MSAAPIDLTGDPRRRRRESAVRSAFLAAALGSVLITALILYTLLGDAYRFLTLIDVSQLWGSGWFPSRNEFDVKTIVVASIVVSLISMLVAGPLGLGAAVYLSEYADPRTRRVVKPVLEILAGVPSVVLGFFALTFITPNIVQAIWDDANQFNMMAAGIGVGILTTPLMASIAEDALRAVPRELREASYGLGARKRTTTLRVVVPAAISGIVAAFILSLSRAIGETMVVTIAAGGSGSAAFNANPLEGSITMTSAIANLAIGSDNPSFGSSFVSLYFVGTLLFLFTLALNVLGDRVVRRYRRSY